MVSHFFLPGIDNKVPCKCYGSILSLVQILFSFVSGMVIYDNEFKTKENKI